MRYRVQEKKTIGRVINIDSTLKLGEDSIAIRIIEPYKASMEAGMNEIIAYSERTIVKDQPEGALGNLVADIVLLMANRFARAEGRDTADICLLNNGGLRSTLPRGAVSVRNVFELMPFENKIVLLQLSGEQCRQLLNYIAREGGLPVAGLRLNIQNENAINVLIRNQQFDEARNYWVVTSDYLAEGGDDMTFFNAPLQKIELSLKVRDALIDYLRQYTKEGNVLDVKTDGRIQYE